MLRCRDVARGLKDLLEKYERVWMARLVGPLYGACTTGQARYRQSIQLLRKASRPKTALLNQRDRERTREHRRKHDGYNERGSGESRSILHGGSRWLKVTSRSSARVLKLVELWLKLLLEALTKSPPRLVELLLTDLLASLRDLLNLRCDIKLRAFRCWHELKKGTVPLKEGSEGINRALQALVARNHISILEALASVTELEET